MLHKAVDSSMIATVGYDPASHVLEIRFHATGLYRYFDVPAGTYEALMTAPSHGQFFNFAIKDFYRYERVRR